MVDDVRVMKNLSLSKDKEKTALVVNISAGTVYIDKDNKQHFTAMIIPFQICHVHAAKCD